MENNKPTLEFEFLDEKSNDIDCFTMSHSVFDESTKFDDLQRFADCCTWIHQDSDGEWYGIDRDGTKTKLDNEDFFKYPSEVDLSGVFCKTSCK